MSQRSTACPWGSFAALLPRAGGAPDSSGTLASSAVVPASRFLVFCVILEVNASL